MKVRIDFWQVIISSYYGEDKMVMTDIDTYMTKKDAEDCVRDWLTDTDYVTQAESFPGRTFEAKVTMYQNGVGGTIERVTDVPEEYIFRRIEINHDWVEKDIPLVFDVRDITKIQLYTKDDPCKAAEPQVLDLIDDKVYRARIANKLTDCPKKTRLLNGLRSLDIETVGDLLNHTPAEIRRIKNVGVKCVEFAQKELKEKYGINWI